MLKKIIRKIINRLGIVYTIEIGLGIGFFIAMIIIILQLALPIKQVILQLEDSNDVLPTYAASRINHFQENDTEFRHTLSNMKQGLFKAASGLNDKPMADKTIERIRSQLELQCIMQMSGEPAAYVNVKDIGLKKCTVGEKICDLFTVIRIDTKSIEISIIDDRITLSL